MHGVGSFNAPDVQPTNRQCTSSPQVGIWVRKADLCGHEAPFWKKLMKSRDDVDPWAAPSNSDLVLANLLGPTYVERIGALGGGAHYQTPPTLGGQWGLGGITSILNSQKVADGGWDYKTRVY